jgi:hypothetical protein
MHLEIEGACQFTAEKYKEEINTFTVLTEIMPTIWKEMKQQSHFWCARMKYFHKDRRP